MRQTTLQRLIFCSTFFSALLLASFSAQADDGTSFAVRPSVRGVDNISGATGTAWIFSATTTAALQSGDIIRFIFPTTASGSQFSLSSATTTAENGITLYSQVTTTIHNLLLNTIFSDTTTPWADPFAGIGSPGVYDLVTTTVEGNTLGGLHTVAASNFVQGTMLHQDKRVATSTDYTFSFYAKSATSTATARFLLTATSTVTCDPSFFLVYNFVSSTLNNPVWECANQYDFATYNSSSPYVKNFTAGTDFERFTQSFHTSSTMQYIDMNIITGLDSAYLGQEITYTAIQLEQNSRASIFTADTTTLPTTHGIGIDTAGKTLFGLVTATLPTSSAFSVTLGGITNASSSFANLQNLSWTLSAGTLSNTTNNTSSLVQTAFSVTNTASLALPTPNTVSGLSTSGVTYNQITLSWNPASAASYYAVYRSTSPSINSSTDQVATTTATSYTHSSLTSATPYYFAVAGVNESATGTMSATTTATTAPTPSGTGTGSALPGRDITITTPPVYNNSSGGGSSGITIPTTTPTSTPTPTTTINIIFSSGGAIHPSSSAIIFSNTPTTTLQTTDRLRFHYSFAQTYKARPVVATIYRQLLDKKNKKIITQSTATQKMRKNELFSRAVNEKFSSAIKPGDYVVKIKVLDSKNNELLDQNEFAIRVLSPKKVTPKKK